MRRVIAGWLGLFALVACAPGSPPAPDAGDGGGGAQDGGGASDAGGVFDAGGPSYDGYIDLIDASSGDLFAYGASAQFFPAQPGGAFCVQGTVVGDCCLALVSSDAGVPAPISAGTVSASLPDGGGTIALSWDAQTLSYDQLGGFIEWQAGDTLDVSVAGDQVHGFAVSATAPQPINGLPSDAGPLPISLSADFALSWIPAGATWMEVGVSGPSGMLTCRVADGAGTATLPAALLAQLATPSSTGFAVATRSGAAIGTSDNARVEVRLKVSETSPVNFEP